MTSGIPDRSRTTRVWSTTPCSATTSPLCSSRSATACRNVRSKQGGFMPEALSGKRTYIIAAATIAYAVLGYYTGNLDFNRAVEIVLNGAGLAALRAGVARAQ